MYQARGLRTFCLFVQGDRYFFDDLIFFPFWGVGVIRVCFVMMSLCLEESLSCLLIW